MKFYGLADQAAKFFQKEQLTDVALWAKFVDIFRSHPDGLKGWKGEYWGKMMRGAALVCAYTQDETLYKILTDSVRDLLTVAEPDGRVSSYTRENEFNGWDLWSRKYVLLGCQYYMEICKDEAFKKEILTFLCRCADYIIDHIGGEGQPTVAEASQAWRGVNSSSILEPMVWLYRLTNDQRYLDFATLIVEEGGARGINIFELAYENKLLPYQYGVSKAYEQTSCFEGLLEYYKVTGIEKYKTAVINYARAVIDSEVSIIGSCGVTHELFDHTKTRQTHRHDDVMQETCVTVTWMKLCARLLELTGESIYADAMEQSFYNAFLGALNTEHLECSTVAKSLLRHNVTDFKSSYMPVDSYSPLTPNKRGKQVGGLQPLPDGSYYGCCACISSAGVGIFLKSVAFTDEEGVVLNFFEEGEVTLNYKGTAVTLTLETRYPADGKVDIRVQADRPIDFILKVRNPGWSNLPAGYSRYSVKDGKANLQLEFSMPLQFHLPEHWEEDLVYNDAHRDEYGHYIAHPQTVTHMEEEDHYIAVTRGPLTLAADSRTGKPADSVFAPTYNATLCENAEIVSGVPCIVKLECTATNGEKFYLVDYASAGRDWQTVITAWLPTK